MDTDYKISCKLAKEAKKALDAFKGNQQRQWPLREIRIHLLDEDGDGLGIWMEYDAESGELNAVCCLCTTLCFIAKKKMQRAI